MGRSSNGLLDENEPYIDIGENNSEKNYTESDEEDYEFR